MRGLCRVFELDRLQASGLENPRIGNVFRLFGYYQTSCGFSTLACYGGREAGTVQVLRRHGRVARGAFACVFVLVVRRRAYRIGPGGH